MGAHRQQGRISSFSRPQTPFLWQREVPSPKPTYNHGKQVMHIKVCTWHGCQKHEIAAKSPKNRAKTRKKRQKVANSRLLFRPHATGIVQKPPGRYRQGRWPPKNRPKISPKTSPKKLSTIAGCRKSRTLSRPSRRQSAGAYVGAVRRFCVASRSLATASRTSALLPSDGNTATLARNRTPASTLGPSAVKRSASKR